MTSMSFIETPWVVRASFVLTLVALACGDSTAEPTPTPEQGPTRDDTTPPTTPSDPNDGGALDPKDTDPDDPWAPPVEQGAVAFPYTAYRCGYPIRQVSPAKPAATFHDAAAGKAPAPKNLHLTIAGNAASSVVIQWSTDTATKQTEVRFGAAPDKLDKIARGFSFMSGDRRQHELHLCGLAPGKTYYYDAGGPAARSKVHKFTTAPDAATDVTLLVAGDTRSNPKVFGGMAASALSQGPTAMLLSGDAVASGGQQAQWDALFEAAPDLFAELPGFWTHGNHEGLDELFFQQLALPDHGGGATQIEEWYAMTYGPLRAIVLNDTVSSKDQITGAEKQFLEASLKAVDRKRTPFVVTMHHKPMYTTSTKHGSDLTLRSEWGPLLAKYKVNADIAGHVHCYESTAPLKAGTTTVTTDAKGGTRFINFGGGGAPLYKDFQKQPWMKKAEATYGYAILKITASTMTWTAYRNDGSVLETIALPVN